MWGTDMKRHRYLAVIALAFGTIVSSASAQRGTTFTGTAVIYGSGLNTRTVSRPFTMIINRTTSDSDATRYLQTLQRGGQDDFSRQIESNDLGRFSFSGQVGLPINAVLVDRDGDDTRIRAVFKRWLGFGELRRGLRSVDYPFTYVEIRIDQNGRGEGTIISAARVRARGSNTLEVEDFGTFPGRLMGVRMRGSRLD
jgi:hypothetical protein